MAKRRRARPTIIAAAIASLLAAVAGTPAGAADDAAALKVPRFVSLHSDKVNLRTGPGRQYPIEWVLTRKDMPVEITAQFENWRRIRGWDGTQGWVQEHMVGGKRFAIVDKGKNRPLYDQPDSAARTIALAEPGVIARLVECHAAWCRIETSEVSGWTKRADLWGVYPDETLP